MLMSLSSQAIRTSTTVHELTHTTTYAHIHTHTHVHAHAHAHAHPAINSYLNIIPLIRQGSFTAPDPDNFVNNILTRSSLVELQLELKLKLYLATSLNVNHCFELELGWQSKNVLYIMQRKIIRYRCIPLFSTPSKIYRAASSNCFFVVLPWH